MDENVKEKYGLEKTVVPVKGCRNIAKKDMVFNNRTPKITVDPETYEVTVDGEAITSKPDGKTSAYTALQSVLKRHSNDLLSGKQSRGVYKNASGLPFGRTDFTIRRKNRC